MSLRNARSKQARFQGENREPGITDEFMSRPYSPPEPDDGAFTYSRDVFAFGVVCLWALSSRPINSYADLGPALDEIDVVRQVHEILARCIDQDPGIRQQTAGVLIHELLRVQEARHRLWAERDRKHCRLVIKPKARQAIAELIGTTDDHAIRKFVDQDINDGTTVSRFFAKKGTPEERHIPGNYYVCGSRMAYQIAFDDGRGDDFAMLSASPWDNYRLQIVKQDSLSSPLSFDLLPRPGGIRGKEAIKHLELALATFEDRRRLEEARKAEESLFTNWTNLLAAKSAYERERAAPIVFSSCHSEGDYLVLQLEGELEGIELEQSRVIDVENQRIRGVIYQVSATEVVLYCPSCDLSKVSRSGRAKLDTWASDIAIERQRTAIEAVRVGGAARGDLRRLLIDPSTARPPVVKNEDLDKDPHGDELSQREALATALGTSDILLVQGPPGTGKTRLIERLIRETLTRDPDSRVLLTSQTHVAIDNALERLATNAPNITMLRIARSDSTVVAPECQPYIVENQLDQWRQQVSENTAQWLRGWARGLGLDPDELETGIMLEQIGALRKRIEQLRIQVQERDGQIETIRGEAGVRGTEVVEAEIEALEREAEERRVQLDSDKKYLAQLIELLRRRRKDAKDAEDFLKLTDLELYEWARVLVGDTEQGRRAADLLRLHAEWLDRFGRDDRSFLGALRDRSSVVAATCIGLASISGLDDLPYDLCIIDEASKATATEALVPMVRAKRWILVGDSRQLPPFEDQVHQDPGLRRRFELDSEEIAESLFERLRRLLPQECQKKLKKQYRMVPPIGRLISECFYDGEVESEERALDPRLMTLAGRAVAWLSTRYLSDRRETRADSSFVNTVEVHRILGLLEELDDAVSNTGESVSVQLLSGYSAQVRLMAQQVYSMRPHIPNLVVGCNTVDSIQGREADVVVFSVTRSNEEQKFGFLREFQRINVALSRARELLVIVGDDEFVRRSKSAGPLVRVLHHIEQNPQDCAIQWFDDPSCQKGSRR